MNILIIGSKGFIGSHCVSYFKKEHNVYQCDVVVDYTTTQYTQIDATNADYNTIFELQNFDVCINCSGAASVPDSIKNPQRDFLLNTVNVFKQLDALRKHNVECKYINLSSAAVYGNPEYLPIDEKHPLNPISPYGFHKKMAEEVCESFYKNFNLKVCSLRIFSAYGEGLKKQLFWDLFSKGDKNSDLVSLFGTGKESRDFIHVSDLVRVIELVISKCNFSNNYINVANGKELTISAVAKTFYSIYNPTIKLKFQGQVREGDPINWVADISKLNGFGFKSQVNLKDGLTNYLKWVNGLK
jgi:dTDP-glucose 4,6-dehydratase/UDP-glucose 4-epimerase